MKSQTLLVIFSLVFVISGGAFMFVDDGLKMPFMIVACISIVLMGILKFLSKEETHRRDDGVETYLDGYDVKIIGISPGELRLMVNGKSVNTPLADLEIIFAYRTNMIPDSPIHIDLWTSTGAIPLNATMPGWDEFRRKLPECYELQNYAMLDLPPWTQNVMKSKVLALLYDTKSRDALEIYNSRYVSGDK